MATQRKLVVYPHLIDSIWRHPPLFPLLLCRLVVDSGAGQPRDTLCRTPNNLIPESVLPLICRSLSLVFTVPTVTQTYDVLVTVCFSTLPGLLYLIKSL